MKKIVFVGLILSVAILSGMSQSSAALGALNQQLDGQYQYVKPQIVSQLTQAVNQLAGSQYLNGKLKILQVWGTQVNVDSAPGFTNANPFLISLKAPLNGSWSVESWFKIKFKVFFFWVTMNVKAKIQNIKATTRITLNPISDPARPKIVAVIPTVDFNLYLYSNNSIANAVFGVFNSVFNNILKGPLMVAISGWAAMQVNPMLAGQPGPLLGAGGPPLPITPNDGFNFEQKALEIESKLMSDMTPYKTVLTGIYSSPWENQGTLVGWSVYGDSAIWTGTYLIAESFRYKKTGSPEALNNAKKVLEGIDMLFKIGQVDEEPGVLARSVEPASTAHAQELLLNYPPATSTHLHYGVIDGVAYVGLGRDFISRDQYIGVMAGMIFAYKLIDDPWVKQTCKHWISTAVNLMLQNNWMVFTPNDKVSTSWIFQFPQQLAYVHAAKLVDPTNTYFQQKFAENAPLSELVWIPLWLETFDPVNSYFKFNLQHTAMLALMKQETNIIRWLKEYYGLRVLRRGVRHHMNAWFNLVEMIIAPWTINSLKAETIEETKRCGLRPRRMVLPDPDYILGVEKIFWTNPFPAITNFTGSISGEGPSTTTGQWISKYPLPPDKRPPNVFLWQRMPWRTGGNYDAAGNWYWQVPLPSQGSYEESPGVDYLIAYWLSRYIDILN